MEKNKLRKNLKEMYWKAKRFCFDISKQGFWVGFFWNKVNFNSNVSNTSKKLDHFVKQLGGFCGFFFSFPYSQFGQLAK